MNKILADIIKHMTPDRAFEDHYSRLQSVVSKILTHMKDFSQVFALVGFDLVYYFEMYFSQIMSTYVKWSKIVLNV